MSDMKKMRIPKTDAAQFDWSHISEIGLYTVPEAARLIGAETRKLRSWIDGYPATAAEPIIARQLPRIGDRTALGFLDLIEARFVRHFSQWFSPQTIRRVAVKLRDRHGIDHPFATKKRFLTDGKSIFQSEAEHESERQVLNLMNDQLEMAPVIRQSLFDTIFYADDLARQWRPFGNTPAVVIDPLIAFGKPIIEAIGVPTRTLYDAFLTEGSYQEVADYFDTLPDLVEQACLYETTLDQPTIH